MKVLFVQDMRKSKLPFLMLGGCYECVARVNRVTSGWRGEASRMLFHMPITPQTLPLTSNTTSIRIDMIMDTNKSAKRSCIALSSVTMLLLSI